MLTPNPTTDRLKFIAKQYAAKKPWIVIDMIRIMAATVGADHWFDDVWDTACVTPTAASDVMPPLCVSLERWARPSRDPDHEETPPAAFVIELADLVGSLPQFALRNRADPIFPWMAQQLAAIYPPITPHTDHLGREANHAYRRLVGELIRKGTMLAIWYERARPKISEYSVPDALKEADEWYVEEGPLPQGEVVAELSDGWTAQKLTTKEQMDREGEVMQHCVGTHGYFEMSEAGKLTIYSLRNKSGRPHVTIEVTSGKQPRVEQVKGKQNARPAKKYEKYVDEFDEWMKGEGISTTSVPVHLRDHVAALEEHAYDIEDEHIVAYAMDWADHVGSAADTIEWLKAGISYSDAELAGSLAYEDVTPAEFAAFPEVVLRKISENGGVPRELDEYIQIARMAVKLGELAPKRDPKPGPSKQTELFDRGPPPEGRTPGHEPMPEQKITRHGYTQTALPSINHVLWERWNGVHDSPQMKRELVGDEWVNSTTEYDVDEWVYPAEEWLAQGFTWDEDENDRRRWREKSEPYRGYVGPWFTAWFTPEEAAEWFDFGIESGLNAAELRHRRVTLAMLEHNEIPVVDAKHFERTADDIVDDIDSRGIARNPGKRVSKRRTSKRKTSKRRVSKRRTSRRR